MKLTRTATGVVTEKLRESRDFYVRHFGFEPVFDGAWYIHLKHASGAEIAFLQPGHPTQQACFQQAFPGPGIWLNLEVDDVDAEHARLKFEGLPMEVDLRDEMWGERHFTVLDPNGVAVNILKMVKEPDAALLSQV